MPIRRYVEYGVFSPEAISAMNRAFVDAIEILGIDSDAIRRGAVAHFIIGLSKNGDLDAISLRDNAVAEFGDPIAAAPTSNDDIELGATPG
jgi:hypothetical protein